MSKNGRKKERNSRGKNEPEEPDHSDTASCTTALSEEVSEVDEFELLMQAVDNLSEKRSATRVSALDTILKLFRENKVNVTEAVHKNRDTIIDSVSKILRQPSSEREGVLAIELIQMVCLALGPEQDEILEQIVPVLKSIATRSEYDKLRGTAVSAIAFSSLICSSIADDDIWELCEDFLCGESEGKPVSRQLQAAAAYAWCLLATVMSRKAIISRSRNNVFEAAVELLGDVDVEVKVAGGLCLAFLWEVCDEEHPGLDPHDSGNLLCDDGEAVHESLELLKQVCRESSKRVSKKDRKEQRAAFRPLGAWILEGEAPSEQVRVQGAVIECTSFSRLLVMDVLREVLGDGFTGAVRLYPVLRGMLGVEFLSDRMDGGDEELKVSKGSAEQRSRTNQRKQDRRFRDMTRHSAMTSDGGGEDEGW